MKETPIFTPPRSVKIGTLSVGAEFRLDDGNEGTVSKSKRTGKRVTVEAICEPNGRARLFSSEQEVWFLGTYSPNYRRRERIR